MSDDLEVIREVWSGRIPICFTLSQQELFGADPPEPYFFLLPRGSYLPMAYDQLKRHFCHFIDTSEDKAEGDELWIEFNHQPLKWQYPVGVLFDLFGNDQLPWRLNVHLRDFPADELLHCPGKPAIESVFISAIKEADALKHKGEVMSVMQKREHKQLWSGLLTDKLETFWAVNTKLMNAEGDHSFRAIPIKVHRNGKHYMQPYIKPTVDSDRQSTVTDLLNKLRAADPSIPENAELLCHGITLGKNSSLLWLSRHLSYPDNFLHLILNL